MALARNHVPDLRKGSAVLLACLLLTGCQSPSDSPSATAQTREAGASSSASGVVEPAGSDSLQPAAADTAVLDSQPPRNSTPTAEQASTGSPQVDPSPGPAGQSAAEKERAPGAATAGEKTGGEQPSAPSPTGKTQPTEGPQNPFVRRLDMPDFPKDMSWLNSGPLRMRDLKGKFVLLDFWTYCCINCIHILPELKKLERAYPNQLVVIGVHSAKFDTEKDTKNIEEAVLRYEIEHPVVNDLEHRIWNSLGISSWPTVLLIDPEGKAVWGRPGEVRFEELDAILKRAIPYYRSQKLMDESPIRFDLLAYRAGKTPLRFPGKVLADEESGRLFISDSNHNRIVIATLDGKLIDTIGSGQPGRQDGDFQTASFDHPQGVARHDQILYVADTENHMIRKVDLKARQVSTIAGTGTQGRLAWPGLEQVKDLSNLPKRWVGRPQETALNSPWALWVHEEGLYIAMAGPHQIWKMLLDESEIGPYAGDGREDIVDGKLLPSQPPPLIRYQKEPGVSSFAQPSGLASDGIWLYVADSEGSSIRAVPFDPQGEVHTVVGTADLPYGRLFEFGDVDGPRDKVRLQHVLGVTYHDGRLYVADTYNSKVKVIDAETGETRTLAGGGQPGNDDAEEAFDEPAGIAYARGKLYVADTNNHRIRTLDLESDQLQTLEIEGLTPPSPPQGEVKPDFAGAQRLELPTAVLKPEQGQVKLTVTLNLPQGWKLNELAPQAYWVDVGGDEGPLEPAESGKRSREQPAAQFDVPLKIRRLGQGQVELAMFYYYCRTDGGLCKVGSVVWSVPLDIRDDAPTSRMALEHTVLP